MKEILQFLRELKANNNKAWFEQNKERYKKVQAKWYDFCQELISAIGEYDEDISRLTIKDCTYRIYRDTRFSKDKSPYKTHFGVFLAKGGKKSMHAGYYFHLGTGDEAGYPHEHMAAAGNYCYEPQVVKILREDIHEGWEEFQNDILGAAAPCFSIDEEYALKRVPRDYPADSPAADWLRQRAYCLATPIDEEFILAPGLAERLAALFRTVKPFNDYINRAVDYIQEGNE